MAEIRLGKLIKQYNIGLSTLVDFLNSEGADILPCEMSPNWRVSDKFLPALEKKFGMDRKLNETASKVDVKMETILGTSGKPPKVEAAARVDSGKGSAVVASPEEGITMTFPTNEGHLFGDGTETALVTSVNFPSRVFTGPVGGCSQGVLFTENITFRGKPVPYIWLLVFARKLYEIGSEIRVSVKSTIKDGRIALLELPIEKSVLFSKKVRDTKACFETLAPGYRLEAASPVAETTDYYVIGVQDTLLLGIVLKDSVPRESIREDGSFPVYVASKGESPTDLIICYTPVKMAGREEVQDMDGAVAAFLDETEREVIGEEDLAIVRHILQNHPQVTRDNCDQYTGEIYCRVPDDSPMNLYMKQGYFKERAFWMNCYRRKGQEAGSPSIILFNENPTVVIEMERMDENQFQLKSFDPRGSFDARAIILRNNRKASLLKVSSEHLHFVTRYEPIPTDYSTDGALDLAEKLGDFNDRILGIIRKTRRERISSNARDYETLTDYLEYKRDKEEDDMEDPVFIPASRIGSAAGNAIGGPGALRLDLTPEMLEGLLPEGEDSIDGMHVAVVDETGLDVLQTGVLRSDGVDTRLIFDRGHLNPDELRDGGMYIRRRVSVRHLNVQISALNKFVQKNSLGIYHELVAGRLDPVRVDGEEDLTFFNPVFNTLPKDNNQPLAVRKAIANENVLLIQGPPGTGKTTIIVEIIRQLAKRGLKVLVCSQAHAAVKNIYDRLPEGEISVVSLDDAESMNKLIREFNPEMYGRFLDNNVAMLRKFAEDGGKVDGARGLIEGFVYETPEQTLRYRKMHGEVLSILEGGRYPLGRLDEILTNLEDETRDLTGTMLQARLFRMRDVVMGTCMGIGMNKALSGGAVTFDTVIIDEAGKANLAETLVPMQLGKRYILVGDHRQLPPFIDRKEIRDYVEDSLDENRELVDAVQVIQSLSNSLFADFFNHPNFPEENKVMLNYQFRMNPEIGQYISDLFYGGELFSGKGTEVQTLEMEGFRNAVTFVATDTKKFDPENNPRETRTADGSYRNEYEARIICNDILPAVRKVMDADPDLKLGIITPYKAQYFHLRACLEGSGQEECVHTIDSIQGSEFDIVIFSFVRSFSRNSGNDVGFLDDMRRLNVSLSRAKKKLILVGNLQTLQNPSAHVRYDTAGIVSPVDVFNSIARNVISFSKASDYELFLKGNPAPRTVFRDCPCSFNEENDCIVFTLDLDGKRLRFVMPHRGPAPEGETVDVVYLGLDEKSGKPLFSVADFEAFCERHREGDVLEGTVQRVITPAKGGLLYFIRVDGMEGTLFRPSGSSEFAEEGALVKVEVKALIPGQRKVYLNPVMTMAERLSDPNRRFFSFTASVRDYGEYPHLTLQLEDGSTLEAAAPLLYRVSEEGRRYELFRLQNGQVVPEKKHYEAFQTYHPVGQFVQGTVVGEDEDAFYIESEDAFGVVYRQYMRGQTLSLGEKRYFKVFNYNDFRQLVIFSL